MAYPVVLDANVIYGIETTDLLLWMASFGLFRPYWSPQILEEVHRNLAKRPHLDIAKIDYRLDAMNEAVPDALRQVPEPIIDAMPINEKDRHVLALAVVTEAETIVTNNLKDFPANLLEPFDVEAVNADSFVMAQVDLHARGVIAALDAMSAHRKRSPKTRIEIVDRLSHELPRSMHAVKHLH